MDRICKVEQEKSLLENTLYTYSLYITRGVVFLKKYRYVRNLHYTW